MTFNGEGSRRNKVCTSELINCTDIMCLQEHHLHEFEKALLEDMFPYYSCDARAIDQVSLLDPSHRPSTGRGGVATFWRKSLDPFVTRLPKEVNERILVIIIAPPGNELI